MSNLAFTLITAFAAAAAQAPGAQDPPGKSDQFPPKGAEKVVPDRRAVDRPDKGPVEAPPDAPPKRGEPKDLSPADAVTDFMSYDLDGDGKVSPTEITKRDMKIVFGKADVNKDGLVGAAELTTLFAAHPELVRDRAWRKSAVEGSKSAKVNVLPPKTKVMPEAAPVGPPRRVRPADRAILFLTLDADRDGRVSRAEVTQPGAVAFFIRADADTDDFVTAAEVSALLAREPAFLNDKFWIALQPEDVATTSNYPPAGSTRPGQLFPVATLNQLNLTPQQQAKLKALQQQVDSELQQFLTAEQRQMLESLSSPVQPSKNDRPRGDFAFPTDANAGLPPLGGENIAPKREPKPAEDPEKKIQKNPLGGKPPG